MREKTTLIFCHLLNAFILAVIVVNKDSVLFSGTYGNCDSIDTPFIIGSMSKSFTALSIRVAQTLYTPYHHFLFQ